MVSDLAEDSSEIPETWLVFDWPQGQPNLTRSPERDMSTPPGWTDLRNASLCCA